MTNQAVVLGAAGFIGSHLVDRLIERGFTVIGVDDFSSGNWKNLENATRSGNLKFFEKDVSEGMPEIGAAKCIYNLASLASPQKYLQNPLHTLRTGASGTEKSLELARQLGSRYVYVSTSEIYGDPLVHPQSEEYWGNVNPVGIRSCYDEAKRYGEALTMGYVRQYGLDAGIVRVFNTYGPRLDPDDGRVVSNMVNQALSGIPLTIYGSGKQTRSFCYVDDLVEGLIRFGATALNGPINLGNPRETSILELSECISKILGIAHQLTFKDLPTDDPRRRRPDISLATRLLGWKPHTDLEHGIRETVVWYKERRKL